MFFLYFFFSFFLFAVDIAVEAWHAGDEKPLVLPSVSKGAVGDGNKISSPLVEEDRKNHKENERVKGSSWWAGEGEILKIHIQMWFHFLIL